MISSDIKQFVETQGVAIVASADASGCPHMAIANGIKVLDYKHILFENWFCKSTLRNLEQNKKISIAVMARDADFGYQFVGNVVHGFDVALLNGYATEMSPGSVSQALTRLVLQVEEVLTFCSGLHSDLPLKGESKSNSMQVMSAL